MDKRINNSWPIKHWFGWKKHNPEGHKFYDVYCTMKSRCNRKTHISYPNYWGRWIKCLRNTFEEFKNDMYESYVAHVKEYGRGNTSIDRIDVDWNYCKENCRWATRREQQYNCRNTLKAIVDGKEYTSIDIAKATWLWIDGAGDRIKAYKKWKITWLQLLWLEKIKRPKRKEKKIIIDWKEYNSRRIADLCWISIWAASQRITRYLDWICWTDALFKAELNKRN